MQITTPAGNSVQNVKWVAQKITLHWTARENAKRILEHVGLLQNPKIAWDCVQVAPKVVTQTPWWTLKTNVSATALTGTLLVRRITAIHSCWTRETGKLTLVVPLTRLAPVSVHIVGLFLVLLLHLLPTPACLKEMNASLSVPNAMKPNEQSDVRLMIQNNAIWVVRISHLHNAISTWHNARQQLFQTADLALYSRLKLRASTFTTDYPQAIDWVKKNLIPTTLLRRWPLNILKTIWRSSNRMISIYFLNILNKLLYFLYFKLFYNKSFEIF